MDKMCTAAHIQFETTKSNFNSTKKRASRESARSADAREARFLVELKLILKTM